MRRAATALYLAALAAYAASFALPAFDIVVEGRAKSEYGFTAFQMAFLALWQEMFGGLVAFLVWVANPAFWAAAILFARGQFSRALAASCAAVLLGCWFVFARLILIGYYVWVASMALLLAACAIRVLETWQATWAEPAAERGRSHNGVADGALLEKPALARRRLRRGDVAGDPGSVLGAAAPIRAIPGSGVQGHTTVRYR